MQTGALTSYMDVAQMTLYAFWVFFAGLIYYLHRENKREGYPLVVDRTGTGFTEGIPPVPPAKTFLMQDGSTVTVPRAVVTKELKAVYANASPGAPLVPVGDPLLAEIGPGAYADRHDAPELQFDDGLPNVVPLRVAPVYALASEDPSLIGYTVLGADGVAAGTVVDAWIDRSEVVLRYVEVKLALRGVSHNVLLPIHFMRIDRKKKVLKVSFLMGAQFAHVPVLKDADSVTVLEEDKITAFYAGGSLYASANRAGPLL